jgi:hypothetical protein
MKAFFSHSQHSLKSEDIKRRHIFLWMIRMKMLRTPWESASAFLLTNGVADIIRNRLIALNTLSREAAQAAVFTDSDQQKGKGERIKTLLQFSEEMNDLKELFLLLRATKSQAALENIHGYITNTENHFYVRSLASRVFEETFMDEATTRFANLDIALGYIGANQNRQAMIKNLAKGNIVKALSTLRGDGVGDYKSGFLLLKYFWAENSNEQAIRQVLLYQDPQFPAAYRLLALSALLQEKHRSMTSAAITQKIKPIEYIRELFSLLEELPETWLTEFIKGLIADPQQVMFKQMYTQLGLQNDWGRIIALAVLINQIRTLPSEPGVDKSKIYAGIWEMTARLENLEVNPHGIQFDTAIRLGARVGANPINNLATVMKILAHEWMHLYLEMNQKIRFEYTAADRKWGVLHELTADYAAKSFADQYGMEYTDYDALVGAGENYMTSALSRFATSTPHTDARAQQGLFNDLAQAIGVSINNNKMLSSLLAIFSETTYRQYSLGTLLTLVFAHHLGYAKEDLNQLAVQANVLFPDDSKLLQSNTFFDLLDSTNLVLPTFSGLLPFLLFLPAKGVFSFFISPVHLITTLVFFIVWAGIKWAKPSYAPQNPTASNMAELLKRFKTAHSSENSIVGYFNTLNDLNIDNQQPTWWQSVRETFVKLKALPFLRLPGFLSLLPGRMIAIRSALLGLLLTVAISFPAIGMVTDSMASRMLQTSTPDIAVTWALAQDGAAIRLPASFVAPNTPNQKNLQFRDKFIIQSYQYFKYGAQIARQIPDAQEKLRFYKIIFNSFSGQKIPVTLEFLGLKIYADLPKIFIENPSWLYGILPILILDTSGRPLNEPGFNNRTTGSAA